jgi:hypothetical protein
MICHAGIKFAPGSHEALEKWGRERKKESCITRGGKGREGGRERGREGAGWQGGCKRWYALSVEGCSPG